MEQAQPVTGIDPAKRHDGHLQCNGQEHANDKIHANKRECPEKSQDP